MPEVRSCAPSPGGFVVVVAPAPPAAGAELPGIAIAPMAPPILRSKNRHQGEDEEGHGHADNDQENV